MKQFKDIIDRYKQYKISDFQKELALNIFNGKPFCVCGRNIEAKFLCDNFNADFVIDDFTSEKTFNNVEVVKMSEISKDAIVVNCSTSVYSVDVIKNLHNFGINNVINYMDLYYANPEKIKLPNFICKMRKSFDEKASQWQKIYEKLEDEISRQTFRDVVLFRLTGQTEFMQNYSVDIVRQYFANAEFLNLKNETFVDCGGFDGDTSEEFIKRCPDYKKILFFEPDNINLEKAKKRLVGKRNIEFISKGVSDKNETLFFNTSGSASNISQNGEEKIEVVKIDDYIYEPFTFIKMDLEGWELNALKGAENSIKKYLPKIAVTPYHNAEDFLNLFEYIMSLNENFKVYIRQYAQGWSETVYFFVPLKNERGNL